MLKKALFTAALALICLNASAKDDFLKGKILALNTDISVNEKGGKSFSIGLGGVSASRSVSLLDVERALEQAAGDKNIAMVYVNADHLHAGFAASEEIREMLKRFSATGKPVVAYASGLGNGSFYLASVADRLFLNPAGSGAVNGLGSTQFFLKDLLDTLGVEMQLIRHGKYKSAGEMYIRNDISPENREQYETLLGSIWDGMLGEMATSRNVKKDDLRAWVDGLELGVPSSWVDKGLVDGLKYRDEMEKYLCHLFGTDDPDDLRIVSIQDYIDDLKKGPADKKVAVIFADGDIVGSDGAIVGEELARVIADVRADSTVKAVVFRVNSPGGEVTPADLIRREIELLQKDKPVVASYGSYAASGGYLISAGCKRIFTDNSTLTGSIGVFGLVPSLAKAIRKNLKVNVVSLGTNAHSTMGGSMEPLTEDEQAWYLKEIEEIYDNFVKVVSDGRALTVEEVDEIAQGRVWSGADALKIGLCDEKGTLVDAIKYVAGESGLEKYRVVTYPKSKSFLAQIFGKDDKKQDPVVLLRNLLKPGFRAMAMMPFISLDSNIVL